MSTSTPRTRAFEDPPGGVLVWLIVTLELLAFAMVFGLVAHLRHAQRDAFQAMQSALDPRIGLGLTAALIASGWQAAEGVHAFRGTDVSRARRHFGAAVLTGLVFVVLKLLDYRAKTAAGFGLGVNDVWDAYFLGTGFHFVHVLVGLVLLSVVTARLGRRTFEDGEMAVAGSALFWHLCDVVWFFLFPLFFAR